MLVLTFGTFYSFCSFEFFQKYKVGGGQIAGFHPPNLQASMMVLNQEQIYNAFTALSCNVRKDTLQYS
jgi:hypothetical protein